MRRALLILSLVCVCLALGKDMSFLRKHMKKSFKKKGTRMVGGELSDIEEYPFSALVVFHFEYASYYQDDYYYYVETPCGGILVSPSVLLTSQLCTIFGAESINVFMGCQSAANYERCDTLPVKSVHVFPGAEFLTDDFVAIVVDGEFDFDPATLAGSNLNLQEGFPLTSLGRSDWDQFTKTELFLFDREQCKTQYSSVGAIWGEGDPDFPLSDVVNDGRFCAKATGTGACDPDQGSAILVQCDDASVPPLVVGHFLVAAGCGYDAFPGVFSQIWRDDVLEFLAGIVAPLGQDLKIYRGSVEDYCKIDAFPLQIQDDLELLPDDITWDCYGFSFADSFECDCECGVYDPDCAYHKGFVLGCDTYYEHECDAEGHCAHIPNTPTIPSPKPTRNPTEFPSLAPTSNPNPLPTTHEAEGTSDESEDRKKNIIISVLVVVIALVLAAAIVVYVTTPKRSEPVVSKAEQKAAAESPITEGKGAIVLG